MPGQPISQTVTPYLTTKDVNGLVDFTKQAFDAVETSRVEMGPGHFHVEIRIGNSTVMIGGGPGAEAVTGMLYLDVGNVDTTHARALRAGAVSVQDPRDTPDGARRSGVRDAFGNLWYFGVNRL